MDGDYVVNTRKTAAEILTEAADLIERHGHCKGAFVSPDGRFCAGGAMRVAAGVMDRSGRTVDVDLDAKWAALDVAAHAFRSHLGRVVAAVDTITWNDAPGRTQDQVVAALREAAGKAEGR
jgi:hypothetical protein